MRENDEILQELPSPPPGRPRPQTEIRLVVCIYTIVIISQLLTILINLLIEDWGWLYFQIGFNVFIWTFAWRTSMALDLAWYRYYKTRNRWLKAMNYRPPE